MSKSNTFENELLLHIFNNADIADIGDAAGLQNSATEGSFYLALHVGAIDDTSVQNTNEATYTGYARVAVARNAGGFTVSGNQATLTANVDFPAATAGLETATHFSVGVASSGATKILYWGTITPNISISNGVTPRLTTGTTITED